MLVGRAGKDPCSSDSYADFGIQTEAEKKMQEQINEVGDGEAGCSK